MSRVERLEDEALWVLCRWESQTVREGLPFFPEKDSASEKPWTLFYDSPLHPLHLYLLCEGILLFICAGDLQVACHSHRFPNCNSLPNPKKPIFAGEISGNTFVLGWHFGTQMKTRGDTQWFWGWLAYRSGTHAEPIGLPDFSSTQELEGMSSCIQAHALLLCLCLHLPRLYSGPIERLYFSSTHLALWSDLRSDSFMETGWNGLWHIPFGTRAVSLKQLFFLSSNFLLPLKLSILFPFELARTHPFKMKLSEDPGAKV